LCASSRARAIGGGSGHAVIAGDWPPSLDLARVNRYAPAFTALR
jgi:hypothetical protein